MKFTSNKTNVTNKTYIIVAAVVFLAFAASVSRAQQSSKMLITWSADSRAPADFTGKILPTKNSSITAALEITNGGKLVNLSKQIIYWYVNNKFIGGGAGAQNITFGVPEFGSSVVELMVQVPEYPGGLLFKRAQIPVAAPEAVIRAPYPEKEFRGAAVQLRTVPYFFGNTNLSELKYAWTVNGQIFEYEENPDELTVNINSDAKSGSVLNIGAYIKSEKGALETASKNISLKFLK